jgi:hypothetical protein
MATTRISMFYTPARETVPNSVSEETNRSTPDLARTCVASIAGRTIGGPDHREGLLGSLGMAGDDQTREVEAVRGRLIERVHHQIREATTMTDMRATERLLAYIEEQASALDAKARSSDTIDGSLVSIELSGVLRSAAELRRRGDTIVHRRDLHAVLSLVDERQAIDLKAWRRLDGAQ